MNLQPRTISSSRASPHRRPCPVDFPRLTSEQLAAGSPTPYLFGGQSPSCRRCHSTDDWTKFCKVTAPLHLLQLATICTMHYPRATNMLDDGCLTLAVTLTPSRLYIPRDGKAAR